MNFYELIANESFARYASFSIIGLGAVFLLRYTFKITPIYLNIKQMVKLLGTTSGEKGFREAYDKLNKKFLENRVLRHSWYEFSEGLLVGENKIQNTKKSIEYFSRETLIYGHLNLNFYQSMPNILTGLGILGTFLGLLCGVSQVNIQEISSIEMLLHGASFSFYTSIAGLSASIVFTIIKKGSLFFVDAQIQTLVEMLDHRLEWLSPEKIAFLSLEKQDRQVQIFEGLADKLGVKFSDSLENLSEKELSFLSQIKDNTDPEKLKPIHQQLVQNNNLISDGIETMFHKMDQIKSDISGQLTENNQAVVRSIRHIENSFDEFKDKMIEENINSVIDALEVVIKDFNSQVNEQFGENFKEYNEAIRRLLEWQKQYKTYIDKLHAFLPDYYQNIEDSTQKIAVASNVLEQISQQTGEIVERVSHLSMTSQEIDNTLTALNRQNIEMEAFLLSIKKIGDDASKSIPEIGKNIDRCADGLTKSADSMEAKISELTEGLTTAQKLFSANATEMSREAHSLVDQLSNEIESIAETMRKATEDTSKKMEQVSQEHSKQIDKTTEQMESNLEKLLNESLQSMAKNLIALSRKFVDDYTPLTDKLQNVIQIAESIDNSKKKKMASL